MLSQSQVPKNTSNTIDQCLYGRMQSRFIAGDAVLEGFFWGAGREQVLGGGRKGNDMLCVMVVVFGVCWCLNAGGACGLRLVYGREGCNGVDLREVGGGTLLAGG